MHAPRAPGHNAILEEEKRNLQYSIYIITYNVLFRKGFYCDGKGGEDINCEEDQRIDINLNDMTWTCIKV